MKLELNHESYSETGKKQFFEKKAHYKIIPLSVNPTLKSDQTELKVQHLMKVKKRLNALASMRPYKFVSSSK